MNNRESSIIVECFARWVLSGGKIVWKGAFTKENNFFLKILSFCFVNSKNVFTFVHSSKFISYGM